MSIANGVAADATNLNAAFASKTVDNTLSGIQTLDHSGSGATVADAQQAINDLFDADSIMQADIATLQADVSALKPMKTEYRTIDSTEFTNKSLILVETPFLPTEVTVDLKGGIAQFYGDDFTVSGQNLDWTGLGLDGLIATGDKLRIIYTY